MIGVLDEAVSVQTKSDRSSRSIALTTDRTLLGESEFVLSSNRIISQAFNWPEQPFAFI